MFLSVRDCYDSLKNVLKDRRHERLIMRLNINLLREVSDFLDPIGDVIDMLEFTKNLHCRIFSSAFTIYETNGQLIVLSNTRIV